MKTKVRDGLIAGEAIGKGKLCYLKSDGKYWLTDVDAAATMPAVAMAGAVIAGDATGNFYKPGSVVTNSSWTWTVGALLYASTTAGAITETAPSGSGDQIQAIGYAKSATTIVFDPSYTVIAVP